MDADLARVARGVAVSRETEDAMTQVLAGAGGRDRADDGHAAARDRRAARAARLPAAGAYYDYEEPPRGRSFWPWLLALGLIIAGGIGGYFLYTKIQDQLNANKPVAVPDVVLPAARPREAEDRAGGPRRADREASRARRCRRARSRTRDPRRRLEGRQGIDGDARPSRPACRRCRCRTCVGQDAHRRAIAALARRRPEPKIRASTRSSSRTPSRRSSRTPADRS